MKSKFLVFLTLLVIAATLLASCAPAAAPTTAPEPEKQEEPVQEEEEAPQPEPTEAPAVEEAAPAEAGGPVKITIFVGFGTGTSPEQQEVHKQLQEKYNSTHEDIQIEFLTVPWAERITKFSTMLAGDMSPDIVMPIGVGGISEFYDEWMDLTPLIVGSNYDMEQFVGKTVEIHNYPTKGILGLPMCVYPTVVFYNKDIFDAAGVDYPPQVYGEPYADGDKWTYDKMVEVAKKLSLDANGNDANSPAFDPENMKQWGWAGWDWANNIEYAMKFGDEWGGLVSSDYKSSLLNTDQYKSAVEFTKNNMWVDHIRATGPQSGAFYDKAGDPMGSGLVGMWEIHSWMKYAWPSWDQAFSWDVAAIPEGPNGKIISMVDADTFVIPKSSKNPDKAWEVIQWFFETENLKVLIDNYGCMPAQEELAASWVDELTAQYPNVNHQVFVDSLDYVEEKNHEGWRPQYAKINDVVGAAMQKITSGETLDVDAVLDTAHAEVQALLDEYWAGQ